MIFLKVGPKMAEIARKFIPVNLLHPEMVRAEWRNTNKIDQARPKTRPPGTKCPVNTHTFYCCFVKRIDIS